MHKSVYKGIRPSDRVFLWLSYLKHALAKYLAAVFVSVLELYSNNCVKDSRYSNASK